MRTDREALLLELVYELRRQVDELTDECAALRARPLLVAVPERGVPPRNGGTPLLAS